MLRSAKVIAFVATKDPARAQRFYRDVLGLSLTSDDPLALVFDASGTMLRVSKVQDFTPANYTVLGWSVSDIDATVEELTQKGVAFEQFQGIPQDEFGVASFPDGTRVAWFRDPDGNLLSVTQFA